MTVTPQALVLLTSTTAVGMLMALSGIHKNVLEWRRRQRVCPSCGHAIDGRVCGRH